VVGDPDFTAHHSLGGDALSRAPRGFDPEHPLIEDIRRKDFVSSCSFSERQTCSPTFLELFANRCREAASFVQFITEAVGCRFDAPQR
jgi:uncharacterized protein (DUF2461 family)